MASLQHQSAAWLEQVSEAVVEPDLPIIDPHHHLMRFPGVEYEVAALHADTNSGHRVEKTVFIECGAQYKTDGPEELRSLGETAYVAKQAALSRQDSGAEIAGLVARVDLRLGDSLPAIIGQHIDAGEGLFRGVRHAGARAAYPEQLSIPGDAPAGLFSDPRFRRGVARLGAMGLTYESWHYHYQLAEFTELARALPDAVIILDHFGTPLGVGAYEGKRSEIFLQWQKDLAQLAQCENVYAKLGGLAMPDNGFGWHQAARPPTSDEFVAAQRDWYLHAIDCFGPQRCMMESNFPVDRLSLSYRTLYNGMKKIVSDFSRAERERMFYGTAAEVYRL